MGFELLASVQSAVRRINSRLTTLAEKVGTNNSLYQDFVTKIDRFFPNNYRFKDGVVQLIKPSQIWKDPDMNRMIEDLDKTQPTWAQIKKEHEPRYQKYVEQEKFFGTPEEEIVDLGSWIKTFTELPDALVWMYAKRDELTDSALEIMHITGRRKTYRELGQATDMTNQSYERYMNYGQ